MCPVELPLQLDHLGRVVGSGTGRIGDRDGQKQLYAIMFYPSMRFSTTDFFAAGDSSLRPAHSLISKASPNLAPKVSAFGIRLQKLLILPPRKIEIAIDLAAAEQQV